MTDMRGELAETERLRAVNGKPPLVTSRTIADEAAEVIAGPRRAHYGDPIINHRRIGIMWGALLDREPIPPRTVAVMMAAMKLVREAGPLAKRDNLVDAVGYLLIAE